RRFSAEAILQGATILVDYPERATAVVAAFKNQGPALGVLAVAGENPEIQLLALRALERPGAARLKILGNKDAEKTLLQVTQPALKSITASGLPTSGTANRLAAIDFLEMLEDYARPAAAALIPALNPKEDVFVRWAAARTIGRISPTKKK